MSHVGRRTLLFDASSQHHRRGDADDCPGEKHCHENVLHWILPGLNGGCLLNPLFGFTGPDLGPQDHSSPLMRCCLAVGGPTENSSLLEEPGLLAAREDRSIVRGTIGRACYFDMTSA